MKHGIWAKLLLMVSLMGIVLTGQAAYPFQSKYLYDAKTHQPIKRFPTADDYFYYMDNHKNFSRCIQFTRKCYRQKTCVRWYRSFKPVVKPTGYRYYAKPSRYARCAAYSYERLCRNVCVQRQYY
jgi:hypothetical protein